METLNLLFPIVTGSFIVPITTWLKSKIPVDFPLTAPAISGLLNLFAMWGLAQLFAPTMSFEAILAFALGGQFTSQFFHAGVKTKNKLLLGEKK